MSEYLTEEERLDALKQWWKENARSVALGIGFGAAMVIGWNVWQQKQLDTARQASAVFQQLLKAEQEDKADAALKLAERLKDGFGSTTYGVYGKLFTAKLKAQAGDVATAKTLLQDVMNTTQDENFKHLARLRLGQVMLALQQQEEALKLIEAADTAASGAYQGLYAELKGDLLVALKRTDQARTAYERARELGQSSAVLELKLQDLGPTDS